jgi:leucyl-tRNA synthetase
MFAAPPEQQLEWSGAGVEGASRFLRRVWSYSMSQAAAIRSIAEPNAALPSDLTEAEQTLRREVHTILKQANFDYQRRQYNTVVSAAMKMLNTLEPIKLNEGKDGGQAIRSAVLRECVGILLRMLYPVVPHLTHRLWIEMGYSNQDGLILDAPWPIVDEAALMKTEMDLVLQVNGKLRGAITVATNASKEAIETAALQSDIVLKALNGGLPKKVIVVPGRLVNIVV